MQEGDICRSCEDFICQTSRHPRFSMDQFCSACFFAREINLSSLSEDCHPSCFDLVRSTYGEAVEVAEADRGRVYENWMPGDATTTWKWDMVPWMEKAECDTDLDRQQLICRTEKIT